MPFPDVLLQEGSLSESAITRRTSRNWSIYSRTAKGPQRSLVLHAQVRHGETEAQSGGRNLEIQQQSSDQKPLLFPQSVCFSTLPSTLLPPEYKCRLAHVCANAG